MRVSSTIILLCLLAITSQCLTTALAQAKDDIVIDTKKAGHEIKEAGKETGAAVKKAVSKENLSETGSAIKEAGKDTKDALAETGHTIKEEIKKITKSKKKKKKK